jgi:hypothetical protein
MVVTQKLPPEADWNIDMTHKLPLEAVWNMDMTHILPSEAVVSIVVTQKLPPGAVWNIRAQARLVALCATRGDIHEVGEPFVATQRNRELHQLSTIYLFIYHLSFLYMSHVSSPKGVNTA